MPRYVIVGASIETGADVRVTVEAATPMAAAEQAQAMRIAVSLIDIEAPRASAPPPPPPPPPHPPQHVPAQAQPAPHVTTERTSKPIKQKMVNSAALAIAGVVLMCGAPSMGLGKQDPMQPIVMGLGLCMVIAGIICWLYYRSQAWWHHG